MQLKRGKEQPKAKSIKMLAKNRKLQLKAKSGKRLAKNKRLEAKRKQKQKSNQKLKVSKCSDKRKEAKC